MLIAYEDADGPQRFRPKTHHPGIAESILKYSSSGDVVESILLNINLSYKDITLRNIEIVTVAAQQWLIDDVHKSHDVLPASFPPLQHVEALNGPYFAIACRRQ